VSFLGCFGCIKDGGASVCDRACRVLAMSNPTSLDGILQDILQELNESYSRDTELIERKHGCTLGRGLDSREHPLVFKFQNESHTGRLVACMRRRVLEPYRDLFAGAKPGKIMAEPEKFKFRINRRGYTLDVDDNYVMAFASVKWYPSYKAKLLTLLRFVLDVHLGNPPELVIHEGLNRA
jgi:hypothetical protein